VAVTENADDTHPPLPLEEVARAVFALTAERTLEGFVARFLESVHRWAAPSAVLAAVRDPSAASGWRLLPALCTGFGPLGAERSVAQLVEELPEDLARPSLVRPRREIPGVRVRENCLVPWSCEGESGVFLLRGVAPPCASNLADAVALLAAPVWPRLLGGPAARVESSVAELRRLAEQLRDDVDRQVERLEAARAPVVAPPPEKTVDVDRVAELERQLGASRGEVERLAALVESLRSDSAGATAHVAELERQLGASRGEAERHIALVESLRSDSAGATAHVAELERQLGASRGEVERLAALVESLRSENVGAASRLQEEQRAVADASAATRAAEEALTAAKRELADVEDRAARLSLEREELRQQVATLEKALGEAEEERNQSRDEVGRLTTRLRSLEAGVQARPEAASAGGAAVGPSAVPGEGADVFRRALVALRRTPFLPPSLRVALQDVEVATGEKSAAPTRWLRVALLDRDSGGLEPLAAELESAGVDVRIASHPEELALLLKTPEGRDLDAAICDVLAFRPDQTVAGIFRGWEKDRPGLALYLSFSRESPPEVERAQRVPLSLTKGRFPRPLNRTDLMEMLEPLRRQAP
jgi:TolA-binding protein